VVAPQGPSPLSRGPRQNHALRAGPRRLVFAWRPAGFAPHEPTEVEVRFEPAERGTRVTVEHRGWDALPAVHPSRHRYTGGAFTSMIGLRWADLLTAMRSRRPT
jgi:hypothetical protein